MDRVEIVCPNCHAAYAIHRSFLGRYAKCKKCGQSFLAAQSDYSPIDPIIASTDPEDEVPEEYDEPVEESTPAAASAPARSSGPLPPPPLQAPARMPLPPPPRIVSQPAIAMISPVRPRTRFNFDWIAPALLLSYLGLLLLVGLHLTVAEVPFFAKPMFRIEQKGYVWLSLFLQVLGFFFITAPAVWGGIILAAKIGQEDSGFSSYLRAAGVASLPVLVVSLIAAIAPLRMREASIVALVILLPLCYVAITLIFDFEAQWNVLALFFAGLFFIPAVLISKGVTNWTLHAIRGDSEPAGMAIASTPTNGRPAPQTPVNLPPPESPVVSLRHRVETLSQTDFSNQSKETLEARVTSMQRDIESMKRTLPTDPDWPAIDSLMVDVQSKLATATSSKPDQAIFSPLKASKDFTAPADAPLLDAPVSFKQYVVSSPVEAKLDLRSSEDSPGGLTWIMQGSELSLRMEPAGNPSQQQPWIISKSFMRDEAERQKLLAIDAKDAQVDVGSIHGLAFTRVLTATPSGRQVRYIARDGDQWLIVQVTSRSDAGHGANAFELSAQSIMRPPAGAAKIDPFAPDRIAPRLSDDPTNASKILILYGKKAEDAVLEQLKSSPTAKRAAIEVLASIGTEKSLEELDRIAKSNDIFTADLAKQAMQKIAPDKVDAIAVALIDLDASSPFKRRDAFKALAAAKPDDRREVVAAKLEGILLDDKVFGNDYDDLAEALTTWARKETVTNLLPVLDEEHGSAWKRHAVMTVLGKVGEAKAAYPIARWLILDSQNASAALISIGPGAEDEVVKLLREKNAVARREAARVLERIGGSKSIGELLRASNDPRDKSSADAARQALDAVRARVKASKNPATTQSN